MRCGFCLQDITDAPFRDLKTGKVYHTACTKILELLESDTEFRDHLAVILERMKESEKEKTYSENTAG